MNSEDYTLDELEEFNRQRTIAFCDRIMEGAMTEKEVEKYLGRKLKLSVAEAREKKLILGLEYQGEMKYPIWQFDRYDVIHGLNIVLQELSGEYNNISDWAKAGYLTNKGIAVFQGMSPIELLKQGNVTDVVIYSRGVGVC